MKKSIKEKGESEGTREAASVLFCLLHFSSCVSSCLWFGEHAYTATSLGACRLHAGVSPH